MRINNNLMALNTLRQLNVSTDNSAKSMSKLSSGQRINSAADDAAGLSISEKMRAQIRGLNQASRNAQDGISLIQTAEGALQETESILQRMRELAVQAANDTNEATDRAAIASEISSLTDEIDRIASTTKFNGKDLLDGDVAGMSLHIGANAGEVMTLDIDAMDATTLGVNALAVTDTTTASASITSLDTAINTVSTQRSDLGAVQNRLEHTIKNLDTSAENLQASESRIRDVDMAKEMSEYTKNNILQQAAVSMLAQANAAPQSVLKLLG